MWEWPKIINFLGAIKQEKKRIKSKILGLSLIIEKLKWKKKSSMKQNNRW